MPPKVSVVVPVWNPSRIIDPCIKSLLAQTMPADELELIFVDDGSTDDSLARLEGLAQSHDHVRVISIPNSGWPGKPRNVGTDAALGSYVMYVDQDDRLDPEALERMYDLGSANRADVVLGKVTSDFRGVNPYLYRQQRPQCWIYDAPLINSQTPHKMLRRSFLIEHAIRYPEGPRRLEDQLFITQAYLAAQNCSIVADYVCYRYLRRPDGRNAGARQVDPIQYFANLEEVLDVVDFNVAPGENRDLFYRRFLRVELLGKLSGHALLRRPRDRSEAFRRVIQDLMLRRFPSTVDGGLSGIARLRAHLARTGDLDDLIELTRRSVQIQPRVIVNKIESGLPGTVRLSIAGQLLFAGSELELSKSADGWSLPASVVGPGIDPALCRIESADEIMTDAVVVDRLTSDEWFLDTRVITHVAPSGKLTFSGLS